MKSVNRATARDIGGFVLGILVLVLGPCWWENHWRHRWYRQELSRIDKSEYSIVSVEHQGELINPFSWADPPVWRFAYAKTADISVTSDNVLWSQVHVVQNYNFKNVSRGWFLYRCRLDTNEVAVSDGSAAALGEISAEYHRIDNPLDKCIVDGLKQVLQR